jgi:NTP pyrophosphatase (non-canonical NTP hydrolase)
MLDLTEVQDRTWRNKLAKGFNTTSVDKEITLMLIEIGESAGAWLNDHDLTGFADELADTVIFAVCVAKMAGVELPDVMLSTSTLPELLPPVEADVLRQIAILFRDGTRVGDAWRFQDLDAMAARIDAVITGACRLARMHAIDLVAAIEKKMNVNDARQYRRDARSGQMVKVTG